MQPLVEMFRNRDPHDRSSVRQSASMSVGNLSAARFSTMLHLNFPALRTRRIGGFSQAAVNAQLADY
jgi:hypothetical protein